MSIVKVISYIIILCFFNAQAFARPPTLTVMNFQKTNFADLFITESALTAYLAKTLEKSGALIMLAPTDIQQENTDYVVTGVLNDAHIQTKNQRNLDTHALQFYKIGDIQMHVTVRNVHTNKIIAALPIFIHKQFLINNDHPLPDNTIKNILTETAIHTIYASVLDAIFPPRIMQIDGDTIYIHRNPSSDFSVGDSLNVYKSTNPGTTLGTVTITAINTDYALATVTTGDPRTFAETLVAKIPPVDAI